MLKFHDGASYSKLTFEQKAELYEWRKSPQGNNISQSEHKKRKASALKKAGSNNAIKSLVQSALAQERKNRKRILMMLTKLQNWLLEPVFLTPAQYLQLQLPIPALPLLSQRLTKLLQSKC